jgi:hypothetical protein
VLCGWEGACVSETCSCAAGCMRYRLRLVVANVIDVKCANVRRTFASFNVKDVLTVQGCGGKMQ